MYQAHHNQPGKQNYVPCSQNRTECCPNGMYRARGSMLFYSVDTGKIFIHRLLTMCVSSRCIHPHNTISTPLDSTVASVMHNASLTQKPCCNYTHSTWPTVGSVASALSPNARSPFLTHRFARNSKISFVSSVSILLIHSNCSLLQYTLVYSHTL